MISNPILMGKWKIKNGKQTTNQKYIVMAIEHRNILSFMVNSSNHTRRPLHEGHRARRKVSDFQRQGAQDLAVGCGVRWENHGRIMGKPIRNGGLQLVKIQEMMGKPTTNDSLQPENHL